MTAVTKYHIFGCGAGDVLLHETHTKSEATGWVAGYIRSGFGGGYDFLRIDFYDKEENYPVEYFYDESEDQ